MPLVSELVTAKPEARQEFRDGWPMLLGALLGLAIGVHALPFGTSGLFLNPLAQEFGWSRAEISFGPTLLFLCLGAVAPFVGILVDRYGERVAIFPGLVCLCGFFFALSRFEGSQFQYYGLFVLVALLASGSATPTYTRIINATFHAGRGRALGIALIGTGVSSALAPPLLNAIIENYGWRAGYLALAGVVAVLGPVIAFLLSRAPRGVRITQAIEGVEFKTALADPLLWLLGGIFFLVALAVGGFSGHFIPMLTDHGVSRAAAAGMMGVGGLFLIIGRLSTGFLIDRYFAPRVATVILLISAAGFFLLASGGPAFAFAGLLAAGLAFGAEIDLVSYLVARYFGMRAYGRIYGLLYAVVVVGIALSPTVYGACYDLFGNYTPVLQLAAGFLALAAFGFMLLRRFPESFAPVSDEGGQVAAGLAR